MSIKCEKNTGNGYLTHKKRRCRKVWKAKKPVEICQYLESHHVPYQCKVILAGFVQTDTYEKVSYHQGVTQVASHDR